MKKIVFYFFLFTAIFCAFSVYYLAADQPFGSVYVKSESFEYSQRVYQDKMAKKMLITVLGSGAVMIILLGLGWNQKK